LFRPHFFFVEFITTKREEFLSATPLPPMDFNWSLKTLKTTMNLQLNIRKKKTKDELEQKMRKNAGKFSPL
jgi:hypothetical protein